MIRSFVFSQGKLVSQDVGLDVLRLVLYDEGVQIWVDAEKPTRDGEQGAARRRLQLPSPGHRGLHRRQRAPEGRRIRELHLHGHPRGGLPPGHPRVSTTKELNMFIGKNFLVTVHDEPLKSVAATIDRVIKNAPLIARAPGPADIPPAGRAAGELRAGAATICPTRSRDLESRALTQTSMDMLTEVLQLKTEVQRLRQIIAPQREVHRAAGARGVQDRAGAPAALLPRPARPPLPDQRPADTYRDSLTNTLQIHLNLQQMQVNRVIKILTVLATLSMPLLIVTSYYGMNIRHMPNTDWPTWWVSYLCILGGTGLWTALLFSSSSGADGLEFRHACSGATLMAG